MSLPSPTTQNALLERFLARQRTKRILPYIKNKNVLDFGCGAEAWNARTVKEVCKSIVGVEQLSTFEETIDGIRVFSSLDAFSNQEVKFDIIVSLAVFEHIRPLSLRNILRDFIPITAHNALVVATVPTPRSRRILETLSYKFRLIDESQIRDHKVYYDDLWLHEIIADTGWWLKNYKTFQLGCNSVFILAKSNNLPC